jgi:hypothetical protein
MASGHQLKRLAQKASQALCLIDFHLRRQKKQKKVQGDLLPLISTGFLLYADTLGTKK